jgi:hypothetical protein
MHQQKTCTRVISVANVISGEKNYCLNITKTREQLQVLKVLNPWGTVHFPKLSRGKRCKCGRAKHGEIRSICDLHRLHQFGEAPFFMVETHHHLRLGTHQYKVEGHSSIASEVNNLSLQANLAQVQPNPGDD